MKKVFNYRNTSNIKCKVSEAPVGFFIEDYPEINKKRYRLNLKDIEDKTWTSQRRLYYCDYNLSVLFKDKKLLLYPNNSNVPDSIQIFKYIDVVNTTLYEEDDRNYWYYGGGLKPKGKKQLVEIDLIKLPFKVDIKYLTYMEFKSRWWKSSIELNLKFTKTIFGNSSELILEFSKEDKNDAEFVVKEINSIRKIIQSEEQEKLISRWEEEDEHKLV